MNITSSLLKNNAGERGKDGLTRGTFPWDYQRYWVLKYVRKSNNT